MKVTLITGINPAKNGLKVQEVLGEDIKNALFLYAKDMNRKHFFEGLKYECDNILVIDSVEFEHLHRLKHIIVSDGRILYRKPYTMDAAWYKIGQIILLSEYNNIVNKLKYIESLCHIQVTN